MPKGNVVELDERREEAPPENDGSAASIERYDQFGQQVMDEMDLAVLEVNDGLDIDSVPSVEQRQKEARVAIQKSTQELKDHDLILVRWRPQTALLTNDGTITEGYFCVGVDMTTRETFSVFIGGIALVRTLRQVKAPMRCRIEQRGRTLVFK